jgi:hypothetical protein
MIYQNKQIALSPNEFIYYVALLVVKLYLVMSFYLHSRFIRKSCENVQEDNESGSFDCIASCYKHKV